MFSPLPVILLALSCYCQVVKSLWPMPSDLTMGSTALQLSSGFDIVVNVIHTPPDLNDAVTRTKAFLKEDKLQRLVVGRGANDSQQVQAAQSLPSLIISITGKRKVQSIFQEATLPWENRSESYSLTVPSDGSSAVLTAESTLGLFRGLTTFTQLWYQFQSIVYTLEAPVKIANDVPAYPYRGFMLDTARNFFPVADIKRTLDAMSWVKVVFIVGFHWHVTDTQSWPLHVNAAPELSASGAYSADQVYSKSDVQYIVNYAGERGIDVIVEIDTPGHTGSISHSHPELVACSAASPWQTFANEPPSGQIRLANSKAIELASSIFASVANDFPSKYISTGGDEINTACYMNDTETVAQLTAKGQTLEQALNVFTQGTHGALHKAGKSAIVWEEMVLNHNLTLSKDTIAMVWISPESVANAINKGFRVIHASSDFLYLDCGAGEWIGADIANSWCDPFKSWQKVYSFDPLSNLSSSQSKFVMGGETLLWTEQSDSSNLDPIVWPRAAAAAEVFWTGPGTNRSGSEAMVRLHDMRYRFVQRGVKAIALQPQWCALRPGACDLNA